MSTSSKAAVVDTVSATVTEFPIFVFRESDITLSNKHGMRYFVNVYNQESVK